MAITTHHYKHDLNYHAKELIELLQNNITALRILRPYVDPANAATMRMLERSIENNKKLLEVAKQVLE